jgi:hypothetical protein
MPAVEIYRDHVLPFYPPVFHKWFLKSFPDPTTWFEARLAYARAIAVMSMVGYLVGFVAALPLHGRVLAAAQPPSSRPSCLADWEIATEKTFCSIPPRASACTSTSTVSFGVVSLSRSPKR